MSPEQENDRRPARLGPESIARTTFPTSFRGYDPDHVKVFLEHIAGELREARDREAALRTALEAAEARATEATELDEAQLTAVLGEETARVLTTAREAAAEIRSKAEDAVARMLREAQDEAANARREADTLLAQRTEEADALTERLRTEAEAEATRLRDEAAADAARVTGEATAEAALVTSEATADAARLRAEAAAETERLLEDARAASEAALDAARAQGRQMVEEARLVRTRILEDLARKRKAARVQLERLQAGRERLLDSYDLVRRTLDEATLELDTALSSAKIEADAAARRVEAEDLPTAGELEAEVEAARIAGLPLVDTEPAETEPEVRTSEFDGQLPEEELVPLEAADAVEEVRLVARDAPPDGDTVVEVVEVVEVSDDASLDADESHAAGAEDNGDEQASVDVDELFARIRAAREAEVAKAQQVLAEDAPPADTEDVDTEVPDVAEVAEAGEVADPAAEADADDADDHTADTADAAEPVDAEGPAASPDDEAILERRDAITDAVERDASRAVKRVLADEQNEVLDRLRRTSTAAIDELLPTKTEHVERYAVALRKHLATAATRGGEFYGAEPSGSAIEDLARDAGESFAGPLRDRLDASLRETAGDDEAMADAVRSTYRDWKTHRVGPHVRDVVIAAFNRGLYDAAPEGSSWRWLIDDGGSPCPDAEDNSLAGLVVRGEPYPTGHCYPPAHPGCRCLLVPAPG